jgi:hypothetical protein
VQRILIQKTYFHEKVTVCHACAADLGQEKPVLAREREARYNKENFLTAAKHLRSGLVIATLGKPSQNIC